VQAESRAAVTGSLPSLTDAAGLEAIAFVLGQPAAADVQAVLAGNPTVGSAMSGTNPLAYGILGGGYGGTVAGSSQMYTADLAFSLDITRIGGSGDLFVGLLDPVGTGVGFDSLQLQIFRENVTFEDQTFTSLAGALGYFDDHAFNLGDLSAGLSLDQILDIRLVLKLTSNDPGASFNVNLVASAVPLPPTLLIFATALLSLAVRVRRRAFVLTAI
jgi:hypothetical protein